MQISVASESFLPFGPETAIAAARQAGLSSVELSPWSGASPGEALFAYWMQVLADQAVEVSGVKLDLGDPAEASWLDMAGQRLTWAARLNSPRVILWAGDDRGDKLRRQELLQALRCFGDQAGETGMLVALDTLSGSWGSSRQMMHTIQDLAHPAIQLAFDTAAYLLQNPGASGEVALQRVCGHLAAVRLSDTSGSDDEFPPLGQGGEVDFARTLQLLNSISYTGPATVAFRPAARRKADLARLQQYLAESLNHLRHCGWSVPVASPAEDSH